MSALRLAASCHLRQSLGKVYVGTQEGGGRALALPSSRLFLRGGASPCLSHRPPLLLRKFVSQVFPTVASQPRDHGVWWYRIANFVRYVRIPVLILGVYQLGHQQGIMDCTKTPKMLQDKIMKTILVEQGVKDMEHVHVVGDMELRKYNGGGKQYHNVATVGQKIIQAAREHVQVKLSESMEKVRAKLPEDMAGHLLEEHYAKDEDCEYWYHAGLRLMGEDDKPWHYVFIRSSLPNAFVTEMMPQRFFITSGLLELAETADELAFVLGHEVSHLVLGHVSEANRVETMLKTLEVLLLSIDPTAGVLALFIIGSLAAMRRALSAAHSRDKEREADDLGVEIAARGCFDTLKGAEVMKKMYHLSTIQAPFGTNAVANLYSSHPPTEERYQRIIFKAQDYNKQHYPHCHTFLQRMVNSIRGKPKTHRDTADVDVMDKFAKGKASEGKGSKKDKTKTEKVTSEKAPAEKSPEGKT